MRPVAASACGGSTWRRCCSRAGCCGARSVSARCGSAPRRAPEMSSLARYIVRTVLAYTTLVLLVLIALGALFLFIGQQDDIGTGGYTVRQAELFVALNLPSYVADLLPVAALIGTLLGLGHLANGSELVVMRASGVSTLQFCRWLAIAGVVLAALMVLTAEFVA